MKSRLTLLSVLTCCFAEPALAWDKHQELTRAALAREKSLERQVEVVPLDDYLKLNFGETCTWEFAKDAVFDGVGKDFQIFYQSRVPYSFRPEWEKANNILTLNSESGSFPDDPQRLGGHPSAREVIATYSDEPDWKLDDDVPRLKKSLAVAEASSGTATRALRHFWTPNEVFMGVDLGKGQETDQRMQLYYELALIAFDSGQDYWGYRFLGNAVHYLEDMAQPFHVQLIINTDMLDAPVAIHRLMCDVDRDLSTRYPDASPARCKPEENISKSIVDSSWYVGTYHGLFEDFALALLEKNAFAAREAVLFDSPDAPPLRWRSGTSTLLDLKSVIRQAQTVTLRRAEETGAEVFATFGPRYVRNRTACEDALTHMGQNQTREYVLGSSYYLLKPSMVTESQFRHRARLISLTQSLQAAGASWARQFMREATSALSEAGRTEVRQLRQQLKARCAAASRSARR